MAAGPLFAVDASNYVGRYAVFFFGTLVWSVSSIRYLLETRLVYLLGAAEGRPDC